MDSTDFLNVAREFAKRLPVPFDTITFGIKGKSDSFTLDLAKSAEEIVLEANEDLVLSKIPPEGITAKNLAVACKYSTNHLYVILRSLKSKRKVKRTNGLWQNYRPNR